MYEINMDKLHEYYSLKEYRENGVCEGYYIVDKQGDIVPDADGASPKMAWEMLSWILTEEIWAGRQVFRQ